MALTAGTRLGPYEIGSPLGSGGMGEVYLARDTRLDRSVAIKVLAPEMAGDPDLRARFEREARAIAALDHAHICAIYDVGAIGDTHFLVMPHLDGQTLAARLEQGPLPLDHTLRIASEIADALDKAHRKGITHRDLKPANIMLTKAGSKLLDFGLAKLAAPGGPVAMSGLTRATTSPGTAKGTILGTVLYMAPEQVEGLDADARTDIWALGAVIYEMATGRRPFAGDTPASVIGAILKDEAPPVSARQPLAPRAFDHLVGTCLAKDPELRWQSAADVRRELDWIAQTPPESARPEARASRSRSAGGWMAAAVLLAALGAIVVRSRFIAPAPVPAEPITFSVYPPPGHSFVGAPASVPVPQLAISPDGRHLAFVAADASGQSFLWLRTLTDVEARRLPGTEHADQPFWTPDSRSVAFFSQGLLKRRDLGGTSPPEIVARVGAEMRGAAWSHTDAIVYVPAGNTGLHHIGPARGEATLLGLKDAFGPLVTARWPVFLPDGKHFVFQDRGTNPDQRGIVLASLEDSALRRVVATDWGPQFAPGYLLVLNGTTLMAHPFDPGNTGASGAPAMIAHPVAGSSAGYPAFSVSATGVLAYSSGFMRASELRWIDRTGRTLSSVAGPSDYVDFRLSPDESRLAFSRTSSQSQAPDVWVRDLARGTESRLTTDPLTEASPQWSPAGDQIIFRSNRNDANLELFRMRPSPGAQVELLFSSNQQRSAHGASQSNLLSTDWSSDGRFIVYHVTSGDAGYDIWALPIVGDRQPIAVARSPFNELQGVVSPDGKWIAYTSDESGRYEVYVQGFPDRSVGQKTTVSTAGGSQPRWGKSGREIFYLRSDGTLMAVTVRARPEFEPGAEAALFKTPLSSSISVYRMDYVPAGDGKRFLMRAPIEGTSAPSITVVLNWPALLTK